jgi:hypothetical protein
MVGLFRHDGLLIDYPTLTLVGHMNAVAAPERSPSKDRASVGYKIVVAMPAPIIETPRSRGMAARLNAIPVIAMTKENRIPECCAQGCAVAQRQIDAFQQQPPQDSGSIP